MCVFTRTYWSCEFRLDPDRLLTLFYGQRFCGYLLARGRTSTRSVSWRDSVFPLRVRVRPQLPLSTLPPLWRQYSLVVGSPLILFRLAWPASLACDGRWRLVHNQSQHTRWGARCGPLLLPRSKAPGAAVLGGEWGASSSHFSVCSDVPCGGDILWWYVLCWLCSRRKREACRRRSWGRMH